MKQHKGPQSLLYSQKLAPYVFVMPFIIGFFLFFVYPAISTIIMSFQRVEPGNVQFIGLENFRRLNNSEFYLAARNNLIYTILTLAVLIPLPMLFAIFLNSKITLARNFFRSIFFIPALTSIVVAGFIFRMIFGELEGSVLNDIIGIFGFGPIKWLGGPNQSTTFLALVLLACWRWTGVNLLYFLSGLQNIPDELYESASIDGANAFQKMWRITVPMLKPTTIYVLTISIFGGLAMFVESFMLFGGNRSPGGSGLTILGYLYRFGWEQANLGFGSAIGLTLLVAALTINVIQLKLFGIYRKES